MLQKYIRNFLLIPWNCTVLLYGKFQKNFRYTQGTTRLKKKEKLDKDGLLALTIIWDVLCNFVKFAQFKKCEKDPCRSVTLSKVAGLSLQLHQKWHCTKGGFHAFWNCANGTKSRNASGALRRIQDLRKHLRWRVLQQ